MATWTLCRRSCSSAVELRKLTHTSGVAQRHPTPCLTLRGRWKKDLQTKQLQNQHCYQPTTVHRKSLYPSHQPCLRDCAPESRSLLWMTCHSPMVSTMTSRGRSWPSYSQHPWQTGQHAVTDFLLPLATQGPHRCAESSAMQLLLVLPGPAMRELKSPGHADFEGNSPMPSLL